MLTPILDDSFCQTDFTPSGSIPQCSLSTSDASSVSSRRVSQRIKKRPGVEASDLNVHYLKELKKLQKNGPLTEAESRAILVRVRNRVSAQKSRTKQRERFAEITVENSELRAKIEALEEENRQLEGALCLRPQAAEPEVLELRHENSALREALKGRLENERLLRERLREAEKIGGEAKIYRAGSEGVRSGTKAFVFLAGLMILSLLFIGQAQNQGVKTMGFDFAPKNIKASPSGEALRGPYSGPAEVAHSRPKAQLKATVEAFDALKKNRERGKISERFRKLKEVKDILSQRV